MKLLHIEDRPENRLLVRKLLESKGHQVTDAADGLLGLELARVREFDLILVDINIPNLNGYEVVTRLRSDSKLDSVPIVAITAEGDREHAIALGFDGFIAKPIKMTSFEQELHAIASGRSEELDVTTRLGHLRKHSQMVVDRLETRVRALEEANERLKDIDRLKMEVLRNVSHELSTPMTPLVGYLKMLENGELGPLSEGQMDVVGKMETSATRLKKLIDNLLSATRFATGTVAPEYTRVRVAELIDSSIKAHQQVADTKAMELLADIRGPEMILVDPNQMRRAIGHLVENGIKFGPEKSHVQIRCWAETLNSESDRNWVVSVTDSGPGIPLLERQHVCEPFYQTDGRMTRRHGGAGLGLAIVDRVAKAHGGALSISQAESGGAQMILRIPLNGPQSKILVRRVQT